MCSVFVYCIYGHTKYFVNLLLFFFLFPGKKYDSGPYLNITSITRDQAGDYECSALNDIASPDTKTVKVTVNCKYITFLFLASLYFPHWPCRHR